MREKFFSLSLHNNVKKVLVFSFLIFLVFIVLFPSNPRNMPHTDRDSGVFLYIGSSILRGDIPYKDVWDHKPPVIYYLNAIGLFFAKSSRWGVWILEFISLLIASGLGFKLFKNLFGLLPAIGASYFWLVTLVFVIQGGNLTTEYILPIQFGIIYLIFVSETKKTYKGRSYFIGILSAIAFLTRPNSIGLIISLLFFRFIFAYYKKEFSQYFKETLQMFIGGSIIFLGVGLFFYVQDGLSEFLDAVFVYNYIYSNTGNFIDRIYSFRIGLEFLSIAHLAQLGFLGWFMGLYSILFYTPFVDGRIRILTLFFVINLPIEVALSNVSSRAFGHYFISLLPIFAIFTAFSLFFLLQNFSLLNKNVESKYAKIYITIAAILLIPLTQSRMIGNYWNYYNDSKKVENHQIINAIRSTTTPDDYVLLWGAETKINFFSQRRSPTRFIYLYPLLMPNYTRLEHVEEFIQDIVEKKPKLIIDTIGNGITENNFTFASPIIENGFIFISEEYEIIDTINGWIFYEYQDQKIE